MGQKQPQQLPFMTAKEAAAKWGVTLRRVSRLCQDGRVPGAVKVDDRWWMIPAATEKPKDRRFSEQRKRGRHGTKKE